MNSPLESRSGNHQMLVAGWFLLLLALTLMLALSAAGAEKISGSQKASEALQRLEQILGAPLHARRSDVNGLVTFLATPAHRPIPGAVPDKATPAERALGFLADHGMLFSIRNTAEVILKKSNGPDLLGMEHVRFQQQHQGIPVTAAEITVHLRGHKVVAANAKTVADLDAINIVPQIPAQEALRIAEVLLAKQFGVTNATLSEARLEILNRGLLQGWSTPSYLAWFIEARTAEKREFIWVDARRGAILLHFNQLPHALSRLIYTAACTPRTPGTLIRSEGGPATGDTEADHAYEFAGDAYNYFFNEHGRDGFDDAGAAIRCTVHYAQTVGVCNYQNSFWSGTGLVFGEGFASADDIVAHEYTHGLTEHTAGLYLYMQSGALNESYSDIFGETIDLTNGRGTDTSNVRWLIGEDLSIGAARSMMTPTAYGDPGKVSDPSFACYDSDLTDHGGTHENAGVPNHAYALMVDGGAYNGYTIQGIGLAKAAHIEYRALTHYLTSGSDFQDNYDAVCQACADLIGTYGISAEDCAQVTNALLAVEMTNRWPCTPAQAIVPELCPSSQTVSNLFFDNLENPVSGNWSTVLLSGDNHWIGGYGDGGLYWNGFTTSGTNSFWGYGFAYAADSAAQMQVDVPIPAGDVRMQFNHCYGFENAGTTYHDGGVIEYSTNGGSTWVDAGSLIVAGAGYGGTISTKTGNPLKGRKAFVRESYGYTASQLSLTNFVGKKMRFRFRMGTDNSLSDIGWFIDDLRIYRVLAYPVITRQPLSTNVCPGGTASFTVLAKGSGTLAYRWQRDQTNLLDGGHYSGVTTPNLTVANVDEGDLGLYSCVITNNAGNASSVEVALTMNDTLAPDIACPSDIITNVSGACSQMVSFLPDASDNCALNSLVCIPPSGSAFLVGLTTVLCVATDRSGNSNSCSFGVTVQDTLAPQILGGTNRTICSDSPVAVQYSLTVTDLCGTAEVVCGPPSGSTFACGDTLVHCVATDQAQNTSECAFTVTLNCARPMLSCAYDAANSTLLLSWPKSDCYRLFVRDDLDGASQAGAFNWVLYPGTIVDDGALCQAVVSVLPEGNKFFLLK